MFRRARATLSWLLLFALPIQAIAGGAMASCGLMSMPARASASLTSSHLDRGGDSTKNHARTADAASPCNGDGGSEHQSSNPATDCAGSGACGVMPMQAPSVSAFLHLTEMAIVAATPSSPPIGFFTGAPDRPPRAFA